MRVIKYERRKYYVTSEVVPVKVNNDVIYEASCVRDDDVECVIRWHTYPDTIDKKPNEII